ncbi:hypothetical protein LTR27_009205 [Elasticomyces elasticus]|nr:hypothetical protein LTR27_009205 [Elasticomyces elasticus]
MASLDTIAPELRLQIYEELLRFNGSLERTMHIEEHDHMSTARPIIADTAILCTSRKIHQEALPVFYKLNTICVHHDNVCWVSNKTYTAQQSCDREHITKVQLTVHEDARCRLCFYSPYLMLLLQGFNTVRYPKLESVSIEVEARDIGYFFHTTTEAYRYSDFKFRYTSLAKVDVQMAAGLGSPPIIFKIQVTAARTAWEYLISLQQERLDEEDWSGAPEAWNSLKEWRKPLEFWARVHAGLPVSVEDSSGLDWEKIPRAGLEAGEIQADDAVLGMASLRRRAMRLMVLSVVWVVGLVGLLGFGT